MDYGFICGVLIILLRLDDVLRVIGCACSVTTDFSLLNCNETNLQLLHLAYCTVMACFLPSSRAPGPIRLEDSLSDIILEKSTNLELPTYDTLDGSEELEQRLKALKDEIQDAKVDW